MHSKIIILSFIASSIWVSCTEKEVIEPTLLSKETLLFDHTYTSSSLAKAQLGFVKDTAIFLLQEPLNEASGIIASIQNTGMFWLHEDSGNRAAIYLYDGYGNRKKEYILPHTAAIDYEDISWGYGVSNVYNSIYLGDIGDNNSYRPYISIYRFPEPQYVADTTEGSINEPIEELQLTYPIVEGMQTKENAEAFFVDPHTGDLVLFTKEKSECKIMLAAAPLAFGSTSTFSHAATLRFRFQEITAADISLDGLHIAIKSYEYIYYWNRGINESVLDALAKDPKLMPYQGETKGEALCWSIDGQRYLTVSELASNISPKFQFYSK